jgi:hypothetical protein
VLRDEITGDTGVTAESAPGTALCVGMYVTQVPRYSIEQLAEHALGRLVSRRRQQLWSDSGLIRLGRYIYAKLFKTVYGRNKLRVRNQ